MAGLVAGEQHCSIQFGSRLIEFEVLRRDRAQLSIEVHPGGSVVVVAPRSRSLEEIVARVRKRGVWICRQIDYFERFEPLPPPRQYVSGETHLYLGRHYRLKVAKGEEDTVKLIGKFLRVHSVRPSENKYTEALVLEWYRLHARQTFERRLSSCLESMNGLKLARPKMIVRRIKSRWGSCSKRGTVLLNTELVKAPVDCIDYVIMHELCHLKIHGHTPAFYRLLSRCMPDWEKRKVRLEIVTL